MQPLSRAGWEARLGGVSFVTAPLDSPGAAEQCAARWRPIDVSEFSVLRLAADGVPAHVRGLCSCSCEGRALIVCWQSHNRTQIVMR